MTKRPQHVASGGVSRRSFLKGTTASAFAFLYVPRRAWGANERVNVASIGIGGKGAGEVRDAARAGANIVGLCDVDLRRIPGGDKDPRDAHPKAKFYTDFRRMLDEMDGNIDAVTISTPDHTHCHPAVMAMRQGKHVYCQKPLTHSIWEARLLTDVARETGVATQMGNQAHAGEAIRRGVELLRAGLVGKVKEVHTWTDRPIWPQGMDRLPERQSVPSELEWDLWLGPVDPKAYAYNSAFVPFKWRGWWAFGTGALGDMGCHIIDMPFWALDLSYPTRVEAESVGDTDVSGPTESTVRYTFPAGPYSDELVFSWYDGGRLPSDDVLDGLPGSKEDIAKRFESVIIGEKGKFAFSRGNMNNWVVLPESRRTEFSDTERTLPRVPNEDAEWLAACTGGPPALSNFDYAGKPTEVVLLGNVAIRLGKPIEWDGPAMEATNAPEAAELIRRPYRKGWEIA